MLSRAGWIISRLRHWVSERNVFLVEQFKLEKIVPSKSQNITDILTLFWFWKSFLNYALKIPFNCDWNVWGYWIISENHTCDYLHVRLRLRTAPSNSNFQDIWQLIHIFFELRVIKWIQDIQSQLIIKCQMLFNKMCHWNR